MLSAEIETIPSFKEAKRAFERRYVSGLLKRCAGNISHAARLAKKDRKGSPAKMDSVPAAILSWEARNDAIAAGALNLEPEPESAYETSSSIYA